jgi:PAS domain S-box-containing protein
VVNVTATRDGGRIIGTVSNFQEMQQFEHSARQLESYKRLNRQLNSIFQYSSDIIWVYDGEGKVIDINKAAEVANSIKAKNVIGKSYAEVVELGILDRSVVPEVLKAKRQVSIVQDWYEGKSTGLITGTPVFDDAGNIDFIIVNARDMTQLNKIRVELEENRKVTEKFKDELAKLNALELKGQEIIAESKSMRQVIGIALKLAKIEASNILILGESGTGKGLLAKFIHQNSKRNKKPFIQINCAALPESLLEAELFGYEKGAFTGAREQGKAGLFELAHEGTLLLDEIGDLPLTVQAKLLKYLDDQEIMRLGGVQSKQVDCTVVAATNRDLEALVRKRKFRQDLFFRLDTFTIQIPPLRQRPDDIFELCTCFLEKYNREYELNRRISAKAMEQIQLYSFPGNVRELKNALKMSVVMGETDLLDELLIRRLTRKADMQKYAGMENKQPLGLNEELFAFEREILKNAMVQKKSTREMAKFLKVNQSTIVRKLQKHGLS